MNNSSCLPQKTAQPRYQSSNYSNNSNDCHSQTRQAKDVTHDSHAVPTCSCTLKNGKRASSFYFPNTAVNQGSKRAYVVSSAHERTVSGQEKLQTSTDAAIKAHEAQGKICSLNWSKEQC